MFPRYSDIEKRFTNVSNNSHSQSNSVLAIKSNHQLKAHDVLRAVTLRARRAQYAECVHNTFKIRWNVPEDSQSSLQAQSTTTRSDCDHVHVFFREGNIANPVNAYSCLYYNCFYNMFVVFRPPKSKKSLDFLLVN